MLEPYVHTAHVVLAGIWLGSLTFTTLVVSPALKKMDWRDSERVLVRSVIGRQFVRVANPLLLLLVGCLLLDGLTSPLPTDRLVRFLVEIGLVLVAALLAASHGFHFGRRLRGLAAREVEASPGAAARLASARRRLQRRSLTVSIAGLIASLAIAVMAVNL